MKNENEVYSCGFATGEGNEHSDGWGRGYFDTLGYGVCSGYGDRDGYGLGTGYSVFFSLIDKD